MALYMTFLHIENLKTLLLQHVNAINAIKIKIKNTIKTKKIIFGYITLGDEY
jgi:hypothetical protein